MALICTEVSAQDIREKPMWIVNLNNGVTVYQSDDNPNLEDRNSWLCLKKYAEENQLYIKDMVVRFRDHTETIGSNAKGYFFVHSILGNFVGYNQIFYKTGVLCDDGLIRGYEWVIPEFIYLDNFEKRVDDGFAHLSLISGVPDVQKDV